MILRQLRGNARMIMMMPWDTPRITLIFPERIVIVKLILPPGPIVGSGGGPKDSSAALSWESRVPRQWLTDPSQN